MSKKIDLTGQRFGRLTVIEEAGRNNQGNSLWTCRCDCGKITVVRGSDLRNGYIRSCGCLSHKGNPIHNGSATRLYGIWEGIKTRCNNPNYYNYNLYGGRGIAVCEEWQHDFVAFRDWALKNGYADNLSIDRIDNDKGYSPDNCRWSTAKEQNANRRPCITSSISVRCVETGKIYVSLTDAEKMTGVTHQKISYCLHTKHRTAGGYHWERVEKEVNK